MFIQSWILKLKNIYRRNRIKFITNEFPNFKDEPVFVIGTSRSGTSLVTSILSQHPDLEGIFSAIHKNTYKIVDNHASGYCESEHLWNWLINENLDIFTGKGSNYALWCHPKYISQIFRNSPNSKKEALRLINAIESKRKSQRYPLLKDQFNLFRVKLINRLYPNARFVLVYRNHREYIQSCRHKWFSSKNISNHESIGLHWYTGNKVALANLLELPHKRWITINYNSLLGNQDEAQKLFQKLNQSLELSNFQYDLSPIDKDIKFIIDDCKLDDIFNISLKEVIDFENGILLKK